ncbi:hypothetical protein ACEN88_00155 [Massilia sp. CT11-108]|uniref:hypothetical protein n=1 Tax=Massilia sp. CT11-108 TaxID=3393900 RepID=UPI0039A745CE
MQRAGRFRQQADLARQVVALLGAEMLQIGVDAVRQRLRMARAPAVQHVRRHARDAFPAVLRHGLQVQHVALRKADEQLPRDEFGEARFRRVQQRNAAEDLAGSQCPPEQRHGAGMERDPARQDAHGNEADDRVIDTAADEEQFMVRIPPVIHVDQVVEELGRLVQRFRTGRRSQHPVPRREDVRAVVIGGRDVQLEPVRAARRAGTRFPRRRQRARTRPETPYGHHVSPPPKKSQIRQGPRVTSCKNRYELPVMRQ